VSVGAGRLVRSGMMMPVPLIELGAIRVSSTSRLGRARVAGERETWLLFLANVLNTFRMFIICSLVNLPAWRNGAALPATTPVPSAVDAFLVRELGFLVRRPLEGAGWALMGGPFWP
jgi:hypothetical protein